jgi:peptide methionine sulfoxide reductase MsrB
MQYAVDRSRFERRVRETEVQIGHIFSDDHRKKIACRLYQ